MRKLLYAQAFASRSMKALAPDGHWEGRCTVMGDAFGALR